MGPEIPHVGIEEDQELCVGLVECHRHGLALPPACGPGRDDPCPREAGHRGGVVEGPVVHDHDVGDEVRPSARAGERGAHAGHDGPHRGGLVARRDAHRHPTAGKRRHQRRDLEVPVVEAAQGGPGGTTWFRTHPLIIPHRGALSTTPPGALTWAARFVHHGGIIQSG